MDYGQLCFVESRGIYTQVFQTHLFKKLLNKNGENIERKWGKYRRDMKDI